MAWFEFPETKRWKKFREVYSSEIPPPERRLRWDDAGETRKIQSESLRTVEVNYLMGGKLGGSAMHILDRTIRVAKHLNDVVDRRNIQYRREPSHL